METLSPGLYFQRKMGTPPMEGVSTSTGAFVGVAEKGEIGKAHLITNFSQFVNTFGGFIDDSYLAYAIRLFFQNGGSRCYVTRTCSYTEGAPDAEKATGDIGETDVQINIDAKSAGEWGNGIEFIVTEVDDEFAVRIEHEDEVETFNADTTKELEAEVNSRSNLVDIVIVEDTFTADDSVILDGGTDGLEDIDDQDYVGQEEEGSGLYSFDEYDVDIVSIPGITSETAQMGLKDYSEMREDCFSVLSVPKGYSPQEAVDYVDSNNLASDWVAIYYPWIEVSDPIGNGNNPTKWLPPSGAVAGIYARTDASRGVYKAPAGYETNLVGVLDVEKQVTDGEHDILNPESVNAIRHKEDAGIVVWGARTLSSNPEYRYISTSRLVQYIQSSLKNSMGWAVFEPNDTPLWSKINDSASDFLRELWREGGLKGDNEEEAFFVKCDGELNTQEVIDAGKLYVDIGIADQKPAEFIVFRLSLK